MLGHQLVVHRVLLEMCGRIYHVFFESGHVWWGGTQMVQLVNVSKGLVNIVYIVLKGIHYDGGDD